MPDHQAGDPQARTRRPDPGAGSSPLENRLRAQILRAGEQAQQLAYAKLRDQVRMELGAPSEPSRGTGDCLSLVLMPLGLILMLVHPAPSIAVWAMKGCLVLAGLNHLNRDRAAIRAADAEAERRWLAPPATPSRKGRGGGRAAQSGAATSRAATASRVRTTASGLRLIESMPSSTRKRAKSGWSLGA